MSHIAIVRPHFVDQAPPDLEPGVLYVSIRFRTTLHLCCCGCGEDVALPIRPDRWHITWDGDSITLDPSIGSVGLPCRSHYFIRSGAVRWAKPLLPSTDHAPPQAETHRLRRLLNHLLHRDGHDGGAPE